MSCLGVKELRRTKIIATLGPSSSDQKTIEALIQAGVNVFRLNFSHGTKDEHQHRFQTIRRTEKKLGKSVAILQDLQGPKLRVGIFPKGEILLKENEEVSLEYEKNLSQNQLNTIAHSYKALPHEIKPGHRILLDDGNLELVVVKIKGEKILAKVVFGGVLKNSKGMNFPDTVLSIESFSNKDQEDLEFGLNLGVNYVALSFVRTANDVKQIKKFIQSKNLHTPVVVKIEKKEAIENLSEILNTAQAVMVARGDLAVEVGTAQVPVLQKRIIHECNLRGIPVIIATQMLESMIHSPRPTRAEASDIANAVLDGADALMLSAETASGKFPILAVSVMNGIVVETEVQNNGHKLHSKILTPPTLVQAIEHAAAQVAQWLGAKIIVCTTHTGQAARALAKYRPEAPILAFTNNPEVQRQLSLVWGVETFVISPNQSMIKLFENIEQNLVNSGFVQKGDRVVLTAGWPPLKYGTTSLLRVITVQG